MITCTRRIQFCAGHRVYKHEGKCAHVHGHNYVAEITAKMEGPTLDDLDAIGRVIDFSVLKEKVGGWIEENWDHGFIYFKDDPEMVHLFTIPEGFIGDGAGPLNDSKHFALPRNPTAELLAAYLLHVVCPKVLEGTFVTVVKVVLHETENCKAEVSL